MSYHKINPYKEAHNSHCATVFAPSEFQLGLIVSILSPIALRVLLVMAAKVQPDGKICLSHDDLARIINTNRTYVGSGMAMLLKYDFVARHKKGMYWLSPKIFRPILVDY